MRVGAAWSTEAPVGRAGGDDWANAGAVRMAKQMAALTCFMHPSVRQLGDSSQ